jgi:hypothetical protein
VGDAALRRDEAADCSTWPPIPTGWAGSRIVLSAALPGFLPERLAPEPESSFDGLIAAGTATRRRAKGGLRFKRLREVVTLRALSGDLQRAREARLSLPEIDVPVREMDGPER